VLARAGVPESQVRVERAADMRLIGQAHEITVELPGEPPRAGDEPNLAAAFEQTYSSLFGRTPPDVPLEVVSWRVRLAGPDPELRLGMTSSELAGSEFREVSSSELGPRNPELARTGERSANFPELDGFAATPVYDRYRLAPGATLQGPAIVEERESTLVIGPGGTARVDELLNVIVEVGR
jgi:N-methylhydantoinase A/oxoprolinase/acetone carboxylase beta subunit